MNRVVALLKWRLRRPYDWIDVAICIALIGLFISFGVFYKSTDPISWLIGLAGPIVITGMVFIRHPVTFFTSALGAFMLGILSYIACDGGGPHPPGLHSFHNNASWLALYFIVRMAVAIAEMIAAERAGVKYESLDRR